MFWLKKDIYWQVVPAQQSTSSSQIAPMQEGGEDGVAEAVVLLDEDEVVELDVVVLGFSAATHTYSSRRSEGRQ